MPTPAADVAHLLRRSGFRAESDRVTELAALSLTDVVNWVLDTTRSPGALVVPALSDPAMSDWEKYLAYTHAWYDRMATTTFPIAEKMTIFWHNHFVSSAGKASMKAMFRQLTLYRSNALGNMKTLAQAMAIDPAMLVYLDNATNTKYGAQQNFARELMELFTMGLTDAAGNKNYSELDVIEVARAWTGYGIDWDTEEYLFRSNQHDTGNKKIFDITRNWDGPEVIDYIFTNSAKRSATARHIVKKLWTYFAHPNPPENVVTDLAAVFVANSFEMMPLLKALFLRPEFYTTAAKQGLVRSPVEYLVSSMQALKVTADEIHPEWFADEMGQQLIYPPSVDGWKWNEYWLSTTAVKARGDFATHAHWLLGSDEIKRHPLAAIDGMTPTQVVTTLLRSLDLSVSSTTKLALEHFVTNSRTNNRSWNQGMVLVLALLCPESNLA
jgi:uncharacterized protein (DUF1800 family)